MNDNHYCVIMAGGSANHFWPISRESRPKQFLDIASTGKSFIRMTYDRFCRIVPQENILVVTLEKFGELVREQIPELPQANLLLEPYSRNTAPCIAFSALDILRRNPEATIVVTPADHIITEETSFIKATEEIIEYAEKYDVLMTMGIPPTGPDTGYGYIQVTGGKLRHSQTSLSKSRPLRRNLTRPWLKCSARAVNSSGTRVFSPGKHLSSLKSWKNTFRT